MSRVEITEIHLTTVENIVNAIEIQRRTMTATVPITTLRHCHLVAPSIKLDGRRRRGCLLGDGDIISIPHLINIHRRFRITERRTNQTDE